MRVVLVVRETCLDGFQIGGVFVAAGGMGGVFPGLMREWRRGVQNFEGGRGIGRVCEGEWEWEEWMWG